MSDVSLTARRLHPVLRVIRNGDSDVNSSRATMSSRVCSTVAPRAEGLEEGPLLNLADAQSAVDSLDLGSDIDVNSMLKKGLAKRKKLADSPAADNAYVNVCIEVAPTLAIDDEDATGTTASRIEAACKAQLPPDKTATVPVSVRRRGNLVSATVPVSYLDTLKRDPDVAFVHPSDILNLDFPSDDGSEGSTDRHIGHEVEHENGKGVLIGIVDVGGFDFAHPDFLLDGKFTRFSRIWDQGGSFRPAPSGFQYGAEFTNAHLNAALDAQRTTGLPATVVERQSQRSVGSHATHVASIAAGNAGICPESEIIGVLVDIPTPRTERERRAFTFSDSSRIIDAIEYLLAISKELDRPISINISLGTNGGAHDGSSGVARWIDSALTSPGRCVCLAAGNAGQEASTRTGDLGWIMGRIHTSGRISARGLDAELEWVVIGNGIADMSENELEIWYSPQDRLEVEVLPPGETEWLSVKAQEFIENKRLRDGTTVSIYNELYHPANGANYISIYLSPNLAPGEIRGIRAGVWRVRLRGTDIRDGTFHCWIERDDPRELRRAGEVRLFQFPSFFSESTNVDSHSISSLACGQATVAVTNYDSATNKMNVTSSQGPTRDGRLKPDIAAPGTRILAAKGFSADDDLWVAKSGTSMASPYVAGLMGLMLNANTSLNAAQCLGILQRTARPLPGGTYNWVNDAGFGRIDPEAAIVEAASFTKRTNRS